MKKQFFRVKQLADQRFSRAGKTEVLSDDLQEADRKVEYISKACGNTSKKISSLLVGQESSKDKRLKKNTDHVLGTAMQDSGVCEEECLLSNILTKCASLELNLANEALDHEDNVEKYVVAKLQQLLDNEVSKHKAKLAKLTLDMDSARTRYQTAMKHGSGNTNSIKEELEDAELKVEQCRDMLASEMFQLISREADLAGAVVQYVKLQRDHHESVLKMLQEAIPELEKTVGDSPSKPVYGHSLEEHLRVTGRKVAFPIELCVCALLMLGMEEEGLFRVAGGASKVRRLKMSFDACCLTLPTVLEYRDPHVIAGALKSYLRELPAPLMTFALYEEWMAAARVQSSVEARLLALKQVVDKLPQANYDNLRYLIKFLSALSQNQEVNKMTPQNIAIVIAPNLLWSCADDSTIGMNMSSANTYSFIVDNLVNHADWIFPGDVEFFQTFPRDATLINGMTSSTGSVSGLQTHEWTSGSPVSGHTRGSSGEGQLISIGEPGVMKRTQSNSSLSDHSSPPHGSPKPAARRKNKPAPVPPANNISCRDQFQHASFTPDKPDKPPRPTVGPISSTLPRPSKKHSGEHEVRTAAPGVVETVSVVSLEKQQKSSDSSTSSAVRKHSTDSLDQQQRKHSTDSLDQKQRKHSTDSLDQKQRKHSTDSLDHQQNHKTSLPTHRRGSSSGGEKITTDIVKSHDKTEPVPAPENSQTHSSVTSVTVTSGNTAKLSSATDNHQQKNINHPLVGLSSTIERKQSQRPLPVAAPRNTVNVNNKEVPSQYSDNKVDSGNSIPARTSCDPAKDVDSSGQDVVLRRPLQSDSGERSNKPAVPERPATLLRPHSSFRGSRHSADSDVSTGDKPNVDSERPMLERTHMYSVEKQQVSIIQVGGEKEKTVAVPINNNNNNEPVLQRSPSVGGRPLSISLSVITDGKHVSHCGAKIPFPTWKKSKSSIFSQEMTSNYKQPLVANYHQDASVWLRRDGNHSIHKRFMSEKPERPPKPENANTCNEREQYKSSHSRTMSEGNIFDNIDPDKSILRSQPTLTSPQGSGNSPGSPRHHNRPPRPQPPPPPPPVKTKQERMWESTDL